MELRKCKSCNNYIRKESNRSWNQYRKKTYCSNKCARFDKRKQITIKCMGCKQQFKRPPSQIFTTYYCSRECRSKSARIEFNCETCGKHVSRPQSLSTSKKQYCSVGCTNKGFRTSFDQNQGRRSVEDREWKIKILKKANYKCTMCGTDRKLEAHHIKSVKDYPEKRHDIDNGLCVCHNCHYYKIHNGAPNFKHGRYSKKSSEEIKRIIRRIPTKACGRGNPSVYETVK